MDAQVIEKTRDVVDYIAFMVSEFAVRYQISMIQSFDYLNRYGGIKYLDRHYEVEHCENPLITLQSLKRVCSREGGGL